MPYAARPMIDDPNDPNKKNQGSTNISGGGGANFATGIPGQESSGDKTQKSSGNYANIQSYLDANKDQGDQMGQTIASNISTKAEDATNKINTLNSKAPTAAAYDPNEAYNNLGSLTDEQKATYKQEKATGGYDGPTTVDKVDGYADTQKATTDAASLVKNAGNEYGQQQLLKDTYARPQYSAGENKLDQVLLQNSAGSKAAIEGVSNKYADLEKLFNETSKNVGNSINSANTQALANKQNILAAEQNQWKNLVDPIQARAAQMNIDNPALINRITQDASDNKLSDETLSLLGLTPGQKIYDMNLGSYITPNQTQVGLNQAANSQERSKYQALADLVGDPTRTEITADGKTINPVTFNKEQFDKDNAAKLAELNRIFANTNLSGSGSQSLMGDNYTLGSTTNIADYLARGDAAINYNRIQGDGNINVNNSGGMIDEAKNNARNTLLQQITAFLEQQNYNRTIEKG